MLSGPWPENRASDFCVPINFLINFRTCLILAYTLPWLFTGFPPSFLFWCDQPKREQALVLVWLVGKHTFNEGKGRAMLDVFEAQANALGSSRGKFSDTQESLLCSNTMSYLPDALWDNADHAPWLALSIWANSWFLLISLWNLARHLIEFTNLSGWFFLVDTTNASRYH